MLPYRLRDIEKSLSPLLLTVLNLQCVIARETEPDIDHIRAYPACGIRRFFALCRLSAIQPYKDNQVAHSSIMRSLLWLAPHKRRI